VQLAALETRTLSNGFFIYQGTQLPDFAPLPFLPFLPLHGLTKNSKLLDLSMIE